MNEMKFVLSPIISKRQRYGETHSYVENVAIIDNGFPWAITHIDTFRDPQNSDIYNRLLAGEVVHVELSIIHEEISEQDKKEIERVNHAILAGMPMAKDE